MKAPKLLSIVLEIHWRYGKNQVWLFVKKYTDSISKKLQTVIDWEYWTGYKDEMFAHFYNKDEEAKEVPQNYGFKSLNCPPQIKELTGFENKLFNLLNIHIIKA